MAVILIDRRAHHHAVDWYQSGPSEPSGNGLALSADDVVGMPSITIDSVLTEIIHRARVGGDVILVCHAREMGLAIPLVRGGAVRARTDAIGVLANDHETTADGLTFPGLPAAAAAPTLLMTESQTTALRQKMNQVRALGLRHVALRGCNVGSWSNALVPYREFFGCNSLSGPTLRDTFGVIPPRTIADVPQWLGTHSTEWHTFLDGAQGSQVGIATRGGESEEHSYDIELGGQTAAALESWGTRHLGRGVTGRFFYHGMWHTTAAPGSPRILFIGDETYRERLHVV